MIKEDGFACMIGSCALPALRNNAEREEVSCRRTRRPPMCTILSPKHKSSFIAARPGYGFDIMSDTGTTAAPLAAARSARQPRSRACELHQSAELVLQHEQHCSVKDAPLSLPHEATRATCDAPVRVLRLLGALLPTDPGCPLPPSSLIWFIVPVRPQRPDSESIP